jgi:hypothetical protein
MAYEANMIVRSFTAGEALTTAQYKAVKLSADNTVVLCSGATDKAIGILQNKPASGATAEVCIFGVTKWQGDADLAAGDVVGTSADGQADPKTPAGAGTEWYIGVVLQGNSTAGGLATVFINAATGGLGT